MQQKLGGNPRPQEGQLYALRDGPQRPTQPRGRRRTAALQPQPCPGSRHFAAPSLPTRYRRRGQRENVPRLGLGGCDECRRYLRLASEVPLVRDRPSQKAGSSSSRDRDLLGGAARTRRSHSAAVSPAPVDQRPSTSTSVPGFLRSATQRSEGYRRIGQRPQDVPTEHDVERRLSRAAPGHRRPRTSPPRRPSRLRARDRDHPLREVDAVNVAAGLREKDGRELPVPQPTSRTEAGAGGSCGRIRSAQARRMFGSSKP